MKTWDNVDFEQVDDVGKYEDSGDDDNDEQADDVGKYKNSGDDDVEQVDKANTLLVLILCKFRIKAK